MGFAFTPGVKAPGNLDSPAIWFAFDGHELLTVDDQYDVVVPHATDLHSLNIEILHQHYLGQLNQTHCYAARLSSNQVIPTGYRLTNMQWLIGQCDDDLFQLMGRAKQILDWDETHRFCGRCGEAMQQDIDERAKRCKGCGLIQYPRIAPSMICLITRGDEVLLARSPNFPPQMYSTLAGFVEPGESIEQAVKREVFEEVGLSVRDIQYITSQPWPFPNSLMVGYHAEFEAGEIQIDGKEIIDAKWWPVNALPQIPPKGTISRLLIDNYLEQLGVIN